MIDVLYSLGQALCFLGLGYGAYLVLRNSKTYLGVGQARFERRRVRTHPKRGAAEPDPHGTELGYWP